MLGSFFSWIRNLGRTRPWAPGWMAFILLVMGPIYCAFGLWTYAEFPGGQDHAPTRIAIGVIPPLYYLIRRFVLRMDDRFDVWMYMALLWGTSFHNLYLSISNGMTPFHIADYLGTLLIIMAGTLSPLQTLGVGLVSGTLLTIAVLRMGVLSHSVLAGLIANLFLQCLLITIGNYQRAKALDRTERESEDLEKLMINSLSEGVVLQDALGNIAYANPSALKILGRDESDFVGQRGGRQHAPVYREDGTRIPEAELASAITMQTGRPIQDFIMGIDRPDGQRRWLRVNSTPMSLLQLRRRGRSPRGVLLLFQDITQEREMARLMAVREAQMSEGARLSALGELAAGVGHEINNPLAAMKLRLEMLNGEWQQLPAPQQPPRFAEEWPRILKSVERIERIVLSLRNLSRDAVDDQLAECSVAQMVQDAVEFFESKAVAAGVQIILDLDHSTKLNVRQSQISQVILNLIQNSLDAIVQGGAGSAGKQWIRIRQILRSGPAGSELVLSVEDSGPGIPEGVRAKLAQPFFTTKPPGKGTGLGLSISRNIMQNHGGSLVPRYDQPYTCFELRFPVGEVSNANERVRSVG